MARGRRIGILVALMVATVAVEGAVAAPTWVPVERPAMFFAANDYALGPDGTLVFAAWKNGNSAAKNYVVVRTPDGVLLPPSDLSANTATGPTAIAVSPNGTFAAAWVEAGVVRTAVMPPGATAFGAIRTMPNPTLHESQADPVVAVNDAGTVVVAWSINTLSGTPTGSMQVGLRDSAGNVTVGAIGQATTTPAIPGRYRVGISTPGAVVIAWVVTTGAPGEPIDLRVAVRPAGGGAFAPSVIVKSVNSLSSDIPEISVAVNPGGAVALAWRTPESVGVAEGMTTADPGGWAKNEITGLAGVGQPRVAIGDDGRAVLAWLATVNGIQRPVSAARSVGDPAFIQKPMFVSGDPAREVRLEASPAGRMMAVVATSATAGQPGATFWASRQADGFLSAPDTLAASAAEPPIGIRVNDAGDAVAMKTGRITVLSTTTLISDFMAYDTTGPRLAQPVVPSTATVGQSVAMSVAPPTDTWSAVAGTTWSFGDGGTGDGTSVSHAYAAPGTYTVTVTAIDAVGNQASRTSTVTVPAPAVPSPPPSGGFTPPITPTVAGALQSKTSWRRGDFLPKIVTSTRSAVGTVFSVRTNVAGRLEFTFFQNRPGRRVGTRCVAPTSRNRTARACVRKVRVGVFRKPGGAGITRVAFAGRISSLVRLAPGRYSVGIVLIDTAGRRSVARTLRFTVVG